MTVPDSRVAVIAREDDTTFGILQSGIHEVWSLALGSTLEDRPAYTPSTTFETFPFPVGLSPDTSAAAYANDKRAQNIASLSRRRPKLGEEAVPLGKQMIGSLADEYIVSPSRFLVRERLTLAAHARGVPID